MAAERLGDPSVGVALDVYHIWWDPALMARRPSPVPPDASHAFHVCDWLVPTRDLVWDRGMMGDGAIDIPAIRAMMEAARYGGMIEVEIMSAADWWRRDPDDVLRIIKDRFATVC